MKKRFPIAAALVVAIFLVSLANAQSLGAEKKIGKTLAAEINGNPAKSVRVILWVDGKEFNKYRAASDLGDIKHEFPEFSAIVTEIPSGKLRSLAGMSYVKKITLDRKVYATRLEAIPLIKSNLARATYSINATPIKIAIIDTGVFNHSEFQNPNRIIAQKCFCTGCCQPGNVDENTNATDDNGHGTHVAGIAAGAGGSFGQGVAVNASIMAIKAMNSGGSGYDSDIATAINWAVQNGANVISLSLGATGYTDCYNQNDLSPLAVDNATDNNVVVVIAAGNSGSSAGTIATPACTKTAITVGAVNDDDDIASFSSRGPINDNRTKPDVMAPGVSITSTWLNNNYATEDGTSMATPFVTGAAALIINKFNETHGYMPEAARVKAIIMTAVNTSGMESDGYYQRNNNYGAGRIDVMEAMRLLDKTRNDSILQGQQKTLSISVYNPSLRVTLYWPENSTTRNNLDLVVGNGTHNFTNPTDANDTVEQVFLSGITNGTWSISVNGTSVTGAQKYFVVFSQHILSPTWRNNVTTTPSGSLYYSAQNYSFQIDWNTTDGIGEISDVIFQLGATNYTNHSTPGVQNSSGTFWINVTDLSAGNYSLIWYANSSSNTWNSSVSTYTIEKAATNTTLLINGTMGNSVFNFSQTANFTAEINITGKNVTLTSNMTLWTDLNETTALRNLTVLNEIGTFNITAYFYGDANYSQSSQTLFLTVNDVNPPEMFLNTTLPELGIGYYPGRTYYFNTSVQDEINVSSVVLQFNSTNRTAARYLGSTKEGNWSAPIADLSANETGYEIIWYANDTSGNWFKSGSWNYAISKNSSAYVSIYANQSAPDLLEYINITAFSPIDSRINATLYSNQSGAFSLASWSNFGRTTINFSSVGNYNFSANFSGNQNYSSNATLESAIITVRDMTAPALLSGFVSPRTVGWYENFSVFVTMYDLSERGNATLKVYNSTNTSVFPLQNLTKRTSPELFFGNINASNVSEGVYFVNVALLDIFGNERNVPIGNITINFTKAAKTYFVDDSFTLVNNAEETINRTNETNSTLTIFYSGTGDVNGVVLAISSYTQNPEAQNSAPSINKFLELSMSNNFSWTVVNIFYNVLDIPSGYNETNLRIYKLYSNSSWMPFAGSYGGVNTTAKYVWANTTSFSLFGAFVMPTCSDGIQNQDETGVDCGGVCVDCPSSTTTTLGSSGGSSSGDTTTTTTSTSTTIETSTTSTIQVGETTTTTIQGVNATTTTVGAQGGQKGTDLVLIILAVAAVAALIYYFRDYRLTWVAGKSSR